MSRLVDLLEKSDLPEGFSEMPLSGVRLFKSMKYTPRSPLLYDPGICIIAQGRKTGYLGDHIFHYDVNNYLVVPVAIPFECETFSSPDFPLLGIYIDIDIPLLYNLIPKVESRPDQRVAKRGFLPQGVGPAELDDDLEGALVRLLTCLRSEIEMQILGPGLLPEL